MLQAVNTQEANKAASNRLPPLWAMVAMVLLGWNEAMSILTSPLKLVRLLSGNMRQQSLGDLCQSVLVHTASADLAPSELHDTIQQICNCEPNCEVSKSVVAASFWT